MSAATSNRLDLAILRAARTHGHARPVERAVMAFSSTGEHAALWLVGAPPARCSTPRAATAGGVRSPASP
ncbi:hypothetical protein [Baekduia soli]|uniref:hypothetical protein n=1 Tax=Baekduia soli TaxID=496014 RepID=UPI0016525C3E|nr:hypothetical protein [Baekduia soli]